MNVTQAHTKHFAGLDAIRFVCAYFVVSSHSPSALPLLSPFGHRAEVVGKLLRDMVNGPAAVIVFFVISGFCIHWPYRTGARIGTDYFVRRYIRIGAPLCAALLISPLVGVHASDLIASTLWSLYCELVYYSIYPLLARAAKSVGWLALTAIAFFVALLLGVISPTPFGDYTAAKVFHDSVLGLPCWLMGCLLAERQATRTGNHGNIWLWRVAMCLASVATLELRFHTPVHFDLSLNFFGILTFHWLSRELAHCQSNPPWPLLERAGAWSYSLYVMHPAAGHLIGKLFGGWSLGAQWLIHMPMTFGVCYLFYRAVEKPSHRLARVAAGALRPAAVAQLPPLA